MDSLPQNPAILVSAINMLLRDREFDSLEDLCAHFDEDPAALLSRLSAAGYTFLPEQNQFR